MVVSLFLCGRREMFFRLCSILYKLYTSSFWLLKPAPCFYTSSKSTKPSWRWHLPLALLCRATLLPCSRFTICFLSVSLIPSVWPGSPEKIMTCKLELHWFTAQLPQACFLRGLCLSFLFFFLFFFNWRNIIYKKIFTFSLSEWFCPSIILSELPTPWQKNRSLMPFIKVNRRYGETVQ